MSAIIGTKKEMTQIFDKDGNAVPVTVVDVSECKVVGFRTEEKDGYNAVVLGKGEKDKKRVGKTEKGVYKKLKFVPEVVIEIRDAEFEEVKEGDGVEVEKVFKEGDKVRVTGVSKGKGFQGVVKRWGFKGGPRTHGQSDRLRAPGSIGGGTDPGRVYKGKKMPGRMGGERTMVESLRVVKIDKENNLLCIRGAVPGGRDAVVLIRKM